MKKNKPLTPLQYLKKKKYISLKTKKEPACIKGLAKSWKKDFYEPLIKGDFLHFQNMINEYKDL